MPANIRLSFENAKRFLEYFLKLPQISQICTDFVVASNGDSHLVSMEKLRRSRRFVRFERFVFKNLIDIYLHANFLLGLLNTNCTNYTNMLLENEKIVSF